MRDKILFLLTVIVSFSITYNLGVETHALGHTNA